MRTPATRIEPKSSMCGVQYLTVVPYLGAVALFTDVHFFMADRLAGTMLP